MRRTSIALLVTLGVAAAAFGWLAQIALTANGQPPITPPVSLSVALVVLAGLVLLVGWPVRQAVRGKAARAIDPFRAMRVLVVAKSSSFTGSLIAGASLGSLLRFLSRGAPPVESQVVLGSVAIAASVVLAVAGIVVERWCRLPPEDGVEADSRGTPRSGSGADRPDSTAARSAGRPRRR